MLLIKHFCTVIILWLIVYISSGQNEYNITYDIGDRSSSFANLTLSDDTIVAYGFYFQDTAPFQQGISFSKIDTNGNIVNINFFVDSLGDDYAYCSNCSIIKTKKSKGYLLVGNLLQRANGLIIRVDNDGNLLYKKEYTDPQSLVDFYSKAIEVNGGFIIAGAKQRSNYLLNAFLMRIDSAGNKIWEKSFGGGGRHSYINSLILKDSNTIVLGLGTSSGPSTPFNQTTLQTRIIGLNSTGDEEWSWQTPFWLEEGGIAGLVQNPDKSWTYACGKVILDSQQSSFAWQPQIVKRDSAFNILWRATIGQATSSQNGFSELLLDHHENYVAVGQMTQTINSNELKGLVFKASSIGDSIWSIIDTAFWDSTYGSENYLSGAVVLPSDNIIACGYSNTYIPTAKSWSWLLKINKDGCMDSLSCTISNTIKKGDRKDKVSIFPNPTTSKIYIKSPDDLELSVVTILNLSGRIVKKITSSQLNEINLSELPAGIYILQFVCNDQIIVKKIIKI